MALLTEGARGRNRVLALLLGVMAASCAVFSAMGEPARKSPFPHGKHGPEQSLVCANCHRTAERADEPGMPQQAQCQICHQKIDADKPPERRAAALFDDGNLRRTPRTYLDDEILFSHGKHVAAGTQCAVCHAGIATDEVQPAMRMNDCVSCHTEQRAANDCATCHRDVRADRRPPTHAFGWQRMHGTAVRAHGTATADDCALCHQESSCKACHMETPPENHDNYFRLRGHGVMARMDRQNCSACHRSDSCDSCHREAKPISHVGAFGAPRDNHCVSCHLPVTSTGCVVCHRSTPSHATARPLPPGHNPAMNCRQCHGRGAPLQHADNGTECITCHR